MLKIFHLNKTFAKAKVDADKLKITSSSCQMAAQFAESLSIFNMATAKRWPKIKSFVPFTREFNLRTMCALQLQTLQAGIEADLAQQKALPPVRQGSMMLVRSKSDTEVYLQRQNYSRPIEGEAQVRAADDIKVFPVFCRRFSLGQ